LSMTILVKPTKKKEQFAKKSVGLDGEAVSLETNCDRGRSDFAQFNVPTVRTRVDFL
jgi:hypothetical protein